MITLRESPSGKPTITAAQNASSTALYLAWQPPHLSTLHGEFLGECTLVIEPWEEDRAERNNYTSMELAPIPSFPDVGKNLKDVAT